MGGSWVESMQMADEYVPPSMSPDPPRQTQAGLILRPGDTLLVVFDRAVTQDEADRYKAALRERLPGLADVVLLSHASAIAAYRPAGD